jgi:hypothetical protein
VVRESQMYCWVSYAFFNVTFSIDPETKIFCKLGVGASLRQIDQELAFFVLLLSVTMACIGRQNHKMVAFQTPPPPASEKDSLNISNHCNQYTATKLQGKMDWTQAICRASYTVCK